MKRDPALLRAILESIEANQSSAVDEYQICRPADDQGTRPFGIDGHLLMLVDSGLLSREGNCYRLTSQGHDWLDAQRVAPIKVARPVPREPERPLPPIIRSKALSRPTIKGREWVIAEVFATHVASRSGERLPAGLGFCNARDVGSGGKDWLSISDGGLFACPAEEWPHVEALIDQVNGGPQPS